MPQVKLTKQFDDYKAGSKMTSYDPKGGPNNDGVFDVSDSVAERMAKAGAIEGKAATKPSGDAGGGAGGAK